MLWGLTAEDNSATRLLRAAGASPEDVHKAVGSRLSMGASQAAERIAWTPCSRKAIAIRHRFAALGHRGLSHGRPRTPLRGYLDT
nr:hypothetical protein [Streptomyces sabulosicollis]